MTINGISTYASHKILNFILGNNPLVMPSVFYIGVSTTPLSIDGIGAMEPNDPAYKRLAITNDKVSFSIATNKIVSIVKEYIFPESTKNWGKCISYIISDSLVGGNVWFYGDLHKSHDIEVNRSLIIDPNTNHFCLDICNDVNSDNICDGSTASMAITAFASNQILNHVFGRSPNLIPPSKFYFGLSSTPLSVDGLGGNEPVGGGYKRLELSNDKNTFTVASNKTVTLTKAFKFQNSEVQLGIVKYYFISDSLTGGNIWWLGKLISEQSIDVSTTLVLKPDNIVWKLDKCNPFI